MFDMVEAACIEKSMEPILEQRGQEAATDSVALFESREKKDYTFAYICAEHKTTKTNPVDKSQCTWRVEVLESRKNTGNEYTITRIEDSHGLYCNGTTPVPSMSYLCKHDGLVAFAIHHSPKAIREHALHEYNLTIGPTFATRLKKYATESPGTEHALSYKGNKPWLDSFLILNPGTQVHYEEHCVTGEFISCAVLFDVFELLSHSFLRTLALNGGFCVTRAGTKFQLFIMSIGEREHRNIPIAFGFFPVESADNYATFLGLLLKDQRVADLVNSSNNAAIHDRHLSLAPALRRTLNKCMNRDDIVHIVRNCKV